MLFIPHRLDFSPIIFITSCLDSTLFKNFHILYNLIQPIHKFPLFTNTYKNLLFLPQSHKYNNVLFVPINPVIYPLSCYALGYSFLDHGVNPVYLPAAGCIPNFSGVSYPFFLPIYILSPVGIVPASSLPFIGQRSICLPFLTCMVSSLTMWTPLVSISSALNPWVSYRIDIFPSSVGSLPCLQIYLPLPISPYTTN